MTDKNIIKTLGFVEECIVKAQLGLAGSKNERAELSRVWMADVYPKEPNSPAPFDLKQLPSVNEIKGEFEDEKHPLKLPILRKKALEYFKEKTISYVKAHNNDCNERKCPCFSLMRSNENSIDNNDVFLNFLENVSLQMHHLFPKNLDILIYILSLKVFKKAEYYRAIYIFNLTKNLKTNIIRGFELYCIRQINKENSEMRTS